MSDSSKLITRIALFSALIYVLSWVTTYLPNINLSFFIAFTAGFVWGIGPGMLVGGIGMWLWTSFNPFGPASLPVMAAQILGMAACGLIGGLFSWRFTPGTKTVGPRVLFVVAAVLCTLVFYLPVNFVDAWVYQPFWPRFISGLAWAGISLGANMLIFPLLFTVTRRLYDRECKRP